MASLIENLIETLNQEFDIYEQLLVLSQDKTTIIISNNLDRLKELTEIEQNIVDAITSKERERRDILISIGGVLNKDGSKLKISEIVEMLSPQPEFQEPLARINEKLKNIAIRLKDVNDHNKTLIEESLSMIQYNINLLQNLNRAPEMANYSKEMFKNPSNFQGENNDIINQKFDIKN